MVLIKIIKRFQCTANFYAFSFFGNFFCPVNSLSFFLNSLSLLFGQVQSNSSTALLHAKSLQISPAKVSSCVNCLSVCVFGCQNSCQHRRHVPSGKSESMRQQQQQQQRSHSPVDFCCACKLILSLTGDSRNLITSPESEAWREGKVPGASCPPSSITPLELELEGGGEG